MQSLIQGLQGTTRCQRHTCPMHSLNQGLANCSSLPVWTLPILFTTLMPLQTRPKMVCLPSRCWQTLSVMKN